MTLHCAHHFEGTQMQIIAEVAGFAIQAVQ